MSMKQQRDPQTVSQLLTQIRVVSLQEKGNSLSDAREFHDPETASGSGASHVTSPLVTIPSSRTMLCRDSGLPPDTRNTLGIYGTRFLNDHLLDKDNFKISLKIQRIWHLLLAE